MDKKMDKKSLVFDSVVEDGHTIICKVHKWNLADMASEESKFSVTKRVITKLYSKYKDNENIAKLVKLIQQLENDSIDNVESLIGLYALDEAMSLLEDILI